jgi:DNA phosphorothioation-dependent restriction protein DptG
MIGLNVEGLKRAFSTRHNTGKLIRIFPFITNENSKDATLNELYDFSRISGEIFRFNCKKKLPDNFSSQIIIDTAASLVDSEHNSTFEEIFKSVCFDENKNLCICDKGSFLYQFGASKTAQTYASYIYDVFLHGIDFDLEIKKSEEIFLKILQKSLPELEDLNDRFESNCYKGLSHIISNFRNDLQLLNRNEKDFIKNINRLFQYYFYFYVTQLAFYLNDSLEGKKNDHRLFYSVDWESLSESRDAFQYGLQLLKNCDSKIFQHAVCIELLQFIEGLDIFKFTYEELFEYYSSINDRNKEQLINSINEVYKIYTEIIESKWDIFETNHKHHHGADDALHRAIYKLYKAIEFQFDNSERYRARDGYGNWLIEYGQKVFGKKRGRLGYTHALSQDYILMFVKLAITEADANRIRLADMWGAFSKRGISFDQFSQKEIVNFLDRNNMLEKKSDSGDAQYVTCGE